MEGRVGDWLLASGFWHLAAGGWSFFLVLMFRGWDAVVNALRNCSGGLKPL